MQRVEVRSLVGELESHMPHGTVKKKRRGDINMRRKEAKSSRITNGAIVYLGKSRELPKKLLELVREFSKAAE